MKKPEPRGLPALVVKLLTVGAALGVLAIGIFSMVHTPPSAQVAAAFTRVGGETDVETAVDASFFWLTPPSFVVLTRADAPQWIMMKAARCAMVHGAPLLFTSQNPLRQRLVASTMTRWQQTAAADGLPAPVHITIRTSSDIATCMAIQPLVTVKRLSRLTVDSQKRQLPWVPPGPALASFVVFAAPIAPGAPPDVAVGMALAAHLATAEGKQVSLVVVHRYVEADPALEAALRSQHQLVAGGLVLGEQPTVPEDTHALLRQLLTSADQQSLLSQVQANLELLGPLLAALLALVGLGAAAQVATAIIIRQREFSRGPVVALHPAAQQTPAQQPQQPPAQPPPAEPPPAQPQRRRSIMAILGLGRVRTAQADDWLAELGADADHEVTIFLRSGRMITGRIAPRTSANAGTLGLWRVNRVDRASPNIVRHQQGGPDSEWPAKYVLVQVNDVEMISVNDPDPGTK